MRYNIERAHAIVRLLIIVFACVLGTDHAVTAFAETKLPSSVVEQLTANVAALTPIALRWNFHRSSTLPPEEMFKLMDQDDFFGRSFFTAHSDFFESQGDKLLLRFDGEQAILAGGPNVMFTESGNASSAALSSRPTKPAPVVVKGYAPKRAEFSFDGQILYFGTPPIANGIEKPALMKAFVEDQARGPLGTREYTDVWWSNYPREVGYKFPNSPQQFLSKPFIQSVVMQLSDQAQGSVVVSKESLDGVQCLRIQFTSADISYTFFLDEALGCAIRRREERTAAGKILRVAQMSDFERLAPGLAIWLPKKCEVSQHIWKISQKPNPPASSPLFTEHYDLVEAKRGLSVNASFALDYDTPGVVVSDYTLPDKKQGVAYTIPPDANDLENVIELARTGKSVVRTTRSTLVLIAINIAVIIFLVALLILRPRRARNG